MYATSIDTTRSRGIDTIRDLAVLACRIGLGILMFWHAKVVYDMSDGFAGGIAGYGQGGVPLPEITGPANIIFEWVGGVAMVLGVAVPLVGVGMAINMAGAWVFVHNTALYSIDGGGPETVLAIGLLSLLVAVLGSGRYGLDHVIGTRRRAARERTDTHAATVTV